MMNYKLRFLVFPIEIEEKKLQMRLTEKGRLALPVSLWGD
jgi:hypothetical protein